MYSDTCCIGCPVKRCSTLLGAPEWALDVNAIPFEYRYKGSSPKRWEGYCYYARIIHSLLPCPKQSNTWICKSNATHGVVLKLPSNGSWQRRCGNLTPT